MSDGKKTEGRPAVRVKVSEAAPQDVGKGIVRLSAAQIREFDLRREDVAEVTGTWSTAALVVPLGSADDMGPDVARLDGLTRRNAGVGIGGTVEVRKAESTPAKRIVLAPAKQGVHLEGSGDALRPALLKRPLVKGDLLSTSHFRQERSRFPRAALRRDPEAKAVAMADFDQAVRDTVPSVSEQLLQEYAKLEQKVKQQPMRIGFR